MAVALIFLMLFLKNRLVLAVAIFSALELLFITLFSPQFSTTFRDLGVLGAVLSIALILFKQSQGQPVEFSSATERKV